MHLFTCCLDSRIACYTWHDHYWPADSRLIMDVKMHGIMGPTVWIDVEVDVVVVTVT